MRKREIKFRAKGFPLGEWRYGNIDVQDKQFSDMRGVDPIDGARFVAAVQTPTIGEFTGVILADGHELYEDDIVERTVQSGKEKRMAVVAFERGSFGLLEMRGNDTLFFPFGSWDEPEVDLFPNLKAIGNIHDNPEMLRKMKGKTRKEKNS